MFLLNLGVKGLSCSSCISRFTLLNNYWALWQTKKVLVEYYWCPSYCNSLSSTRRVEPFYSQESISFKFPLQLHQKYNITRHAFHSLNRWKMIILPIIVTTSRKGCVTLVNLQRQLAMIWCCAKNHSSVTARCERFFAIFAVLQRVASFWKRFKSVTCLQIRARNMRCESALQVGVANWPV